MFLGYPKFFNLGEEKLLILALQVVCDDREKMIDEFPSSIEFRIGSYSFGIPDEEVVLTL